MLKRDKQKHFKKVRRNMLIKKLIKRGKIIALQPLRPRHTDTETAIKGKPWKKSSPNLKKMP